MSEDTNVGSIFLDLIVRDTVEKQVQGMAAKGQATAQKAFSGMEKAVETSVNNTASQTEKMIGKVMHFGEMLANGPARFAEKALGRIGTASKASADGVAKVAETAGQRIEKSVADSFDKPVALAQARVRELEREYARVSDRRSEVMWSYSYNEDGDKATDRLVERLTAQREALYNRLLSARERLAIQLQVAAQREAAAENKAAQKTTAVTQREAKRREKIHESMWKNMLATAGNASNAITKKAAGITSGFGKAGKATNYLGNRFKGILASALIFNGISALLRNVTSHLWETVSSTDAMKEALANLKGAAATAAAPIVDILTPALVKLTNAAATAFSYLSKLISAITGESVADMAKLAQSAADAAKKVKGSLAGFDEIEKAGDSDSAKKNYDFQGESAFLESILSAFDFSQAIASTKNLGQSLYDFGAIIRDALAWAWEELLLHLSEWTVEVATPAAIDALTEALSALNVTLQLVADGLAILWEDLQPVTTFIGENVVYAFGQCELAFGKLTQIFTEKSPEITSIFSGIGDAVQALWTVLEPIFTKWREIYWEIEQFKFDQTLNSIGFLIDALEGLVEFVAGALTGNWDRAWKGIQNCAKGAINGIISFINGMISGIVSGVNTVINALNGLSFVIPNWVPEVGGETFGFNIKPLSAPQIPMLADGGVITQPTLAMMGEYPGANSNPEIVAPQSVMEETVAKVMREFAEQNRQSLEAAIDILRDILEAVLGIQLTDEMIGKATARYNAEMAIIRGGNA